jgi:hypothetical protein
MMKLTQEEVENTLDHIGMDYCNSSSSAIQRKYWQMGVHKTEKLLHSKGNSHQTEETAYTMGENLCQLYIWLRINNQNTWGAQKK